MSTWPQSLLDLPRVRSPHGSLMRPSCSTASSQFTMADDSLLEQVDLALQSRGSTALRTQ
jgi:hypothetical protein